MNAKLQNRPLEVYKYIVLVIKKLWTLNGAIFTGTSIALLYFGYKTFPEIIPSFFLGIILFLLVLIVCGGLVWGDQVKLARQTEKELKKLKMTIPKFTLTELTVDKYTILPLIEKYKKTLSALSMTLKKTQIKSDKNNNLTSSILSPLFVTSVLNSAKIIQAQMLKSTNPYFTSQGGESADQEYRRIENHIHNLELYEKKLNNIYIIKSRYASTVSATNVEISMSSDDASLMLRDDYIWDKLPRTSPPSNGLFPNDFSPLYSGDLRHSSSYIEDGIAHSGTTQHINSGVSENIFDTDLYVNTSNNELILKFSFIAHKNNQTQYIIKSIDLSTVPLIEIATDKK